MSLTNDPAIWFKDLFVHAGLSYSLSSLLSAVALVLIVIFISWISNLLAKAVILQIVTRIVRKTTTTWDDVFLENKVFTRLSHFAPALVIWFMAAWALRDYPSWLLTVHKLAYIYMVMIGMVVMNTFIDSWHEIYNTLPIAQHRHIKGYVQLVKIFVILIAALIIVSVLFDKNISTLVAGLGAMAAVLILVFRDTLLGLVASIQLSANKMVKVGDWITIPSRNVDGNVIDITLNTVKIQNFDKTILTVPTYSLVNDSFQNWEGMEASGIRQAKRIICIDIKSIKFPDRELREKLYTVPLLKEFIETKEKDSDNQNTDVSNFFNTSKITNLGVFRFYAENYLRQIPEVDSDQTILVRHLPIDGDGIKLELYLFLKSTKFAPYENVMSGVMEHLLAIMNEFGLKGYQHPSDNDLGFLYSK